MDEGPVITETELQFMEISLLMVSVQKKNHEVLSATKVKSSKRKSINTLTYLNNEIRKFLIRKQSIRNHNKSYYYENNDKYMKSLILEEVCKKKVSKPFKPYAFL